MDIPEWISMRFHRYLHGYPCVLLDIHGCVLWMIGHGYLSDNELFTLRIYTDVKGYLFMGNQTWISIANWDTHMDIHEKKNMSTYGYPHEFFDAVHQLWLRSQLLTTIIDQKRWKILHLKFPRWFPLKLIYIQKRKQGKRPFRSTKAPGAPPMGRRGKWCWSRENTTVVTRRGKSIDQISDHLSTNCGDGPRNQRQ